MFQHKINRALNINKIIKYFLSKYKNFDEDLGLHSKTEFSDKGFANSYDSNSISYVF